MMLMLRCWRSMASWTLRSDLADGAVVDRVWDGNEHAVTPFLGSAAFKTTKVPPDIASQNTSARPAERQAWRREP